MTYYASGVGTLNYITYPVGPTAAGLTATGSGTNTKGAYVEVTAALGFTSMAVIHAVLAAPSATSRNLTDFATGAASSEVVRIPNLMSSSPGTAGSAHGNLHGDYIPWGVSTSTRIAARTQSSSNNGRHEFGLTVFSFGDVPGPTTYTNYGADTADSGGTAVDPGGTANTKGAYSEIAASTSAVIQALMLMITSGGNAAPTSARWAIDLATGAAASEVVLIPDVRCAVGTNNEMLLPNSFNLPTYIAAATRIAVRASCSITDATDRLLDASLIGSVAPSEPSGDTFIVPVTETAVFTRGRMRAY